MFNNNKDESIDDPRILRQKAQIECKAKSAIRAECEKNFGIGENVCAGVSYDEK
eukprot:Pgem_evm1s14044